MIGELARYYHVSIGEVLTWPWDEIAAWTGTAIGQVHDEARAARWRR